jgi:hypothetical protein
MDLLGLYFRPGLGVQAGIRNRFGEPVNYFPLQGLKEFFLIASVGRCKYQLNENSIGLLLQVTLGGVAADFRLQQLSNRVFKFAVASPNVGFHIYKLCVYVCDQYKIFFNLYGNGGAHWISEYKKFLREEAEEWTPVLGKRANYQRQFYRAAETVLPGSDRTLIDYRRQSRARKAFHKTPKQILSGANRIPINNRHFAQSGQANLSWVHRRQGMQTDNRKSKHVQADFRPDQAELHPDKLRKSSVFQRIQGPSLVRNLHSSSSHHQIHPDKVKNMQWRRKSLRSSRFQIKLTKASDL